MDQLVLQPDFSFLRRLKKEAKVLAILGWPIVVTQLLQVATYALDTIMSGRASARDLAGVSVGTGLWIPVFLFSLGLLMALTPVVAQAKGSRQDHQIASAVYQAFWIAIGSGGLILLFFLNVDPLLNWINVDNEIRPVASGYLYAISFGMPAIVGFNLLRAYAEGLSTTRPAMVASIAGLVVNAPLNYILIYGYFGFPALGGIGCGWASTIALWVSFLTMIGYVISNKAFYGISLFRNVYAPDWLKIRELLKLGIPIGCSFLVESSLFAVVALLLSGYNSIVVASHQITLNVVSIVFTVPFSLGIALTIRVGFLLGSKQVVDARFTSYLGVGLAIIYGIVIGIILWFFTANIVSLYSRDTIVQSSAANLLAIAAIFQLVDAFQVTCIGALRGYKDTTLPLFVTVIGLWMLALPLGYCLAMTDRFGPPWYAKGFWVAMVAGIFFVATCLSRRLHILSGARITIQ